jgi:TPR repeat protein
VGYSYHEGIGVRRDAKVAAHWYRHAVRADDVYAQYNLGLCYLEGDGVPRNRRLARNWFQKAARQGHQKAAQRLSEIDSPTQSTERRY